MKAENMTDIEVCVSEESFFTADSSYQPILTFHFDAYPKALDFIRLCLEQGKNVAIKNYSEEINNVCEESGE